MDKDDVIVVTGGGGFIGGHLVADLLRQGYTRIRSVDIKPVDDWYQVFSEAENLQLDLREKAVCYQAVRGARFVFNLAADMGGMGFIETHKADCMLSVMINTNLLLAARDHTAERFFYASSACVYAADKQTSADVLPLKESDAYPAMPEDGYGWEKLFSERMCRHFYEDYGLATRVARYHNVYGPHGTYDGGREKAPAAICRKVITALVTGNHEIEIWGDGEQTRSFMYIDDCVYGTQTLMSSDVREPINIGSDELVTINQLVDIVEGIAGITLKRHYNLDAPKGVRGRNSDNTLIKQKLGWAPSIPLQEGMQKTVLAARSLGLPTVIHEANIVPGLTNRLLGRFVQRVYLGFAAAGWAFAPQHTRVTGNPIRPDIVQLHLSPRSAPAAEKRPAHILVTSGSQGSRFLNQYVPELLSAIASRGIALEVWHQSGEEDCQPIQTVYSRIGVPARVTSYIPAMAAAYRWADFAVTCAGALTLSELAVVGLPALFVPLAVTAGDHQTQNALAMTEAGAGWLVPEAQWHTDDLARRLTTLLDDANAWHDASQRMRRVAIPDAAQTVVSDCEALLAA